MQTEVTRLLGIEYPIIQGGIDVYKRQAYGIPNRPDAMESAPNVLNTVCQEYPAEYPTPIPPMIPI